MWIRDHEFTKEEITKGKDFSEGFYLFGGINSSGAVMNDLWLIKPDYQYNARRLFDNKHKVEKEIGLCLHKINDFHG